MKNLLYFSEAGCDPPDFRISRKKSSSLKSGPTEQPFVTFETTTLYLPQDFTSHDLEFVGSFVEEQIHNDAVKIIENPYWFDFDSTVALTGVQHSKHHHLKRAKRNHNRKLKRSKHVENNRNNEDPIPEEIFSASEVIGNIFNENDTHGMQNGKYNGLCVNFMYVETQRIFFPDDSDLYDFENILEELKELESNNNFHEGILNYYSLL